MATEDGLTSAGTGGKSAELRPYRVAMILKAVVSAPPTRAETLMVLTFSSDVFLISGCASNTYGVPFATGKSCLTSAALSCAGQAESGVAAATLTDPPTSALTAFGELVVVSRSNSMPNLCGSS